MEGILNLISPIHWDSNPNGYDLVLIDGSKTFYFFDGGGSCCDVGNAITNIINVGNVIDIQLPIQEWDIDSEQYGLIITDDSGKVHYFNKDGSYEGWGRDCIFIWN